MKENFLFKGKMIIIIKNILAYYRGKGSNELFWSKVVVVVVVNFSWKLSSSPESQGQFDWNKLGTVMTVYMFKEGGGGH